MRKRTLIEAGSGAAIAAPLGGTAGYAIISGIWWLVAMCGGIWLCFIGYLAIGAWRDGRYLARGGRHHA